MSSLPAASSIEMFVCVAFMHVYIYRCGACAVCSQVLSLTDTWVTYSNNLIKLTFFVYNYTIPIMKIFFDTLAQEARLNM